MGENSENDGIDFCDNFYGKVCELKLKILQYFKKFIAKFFRT